MTGNFDCLKVEIYGESHSEYIGVKVSGLPCGLMFKLNAVTEMLKRRQASDNVWSTKRMEKDVFEFISGVDVMSDSATTTGAVVEARIKNNDINKDAYNNTILIPRPSHADYAAYMKDGKISSGGGRFSGRMTAPMCIIGAIAKTLLEEKNIKVFAFASNIGGIDLGSYKKDKIDENALNLSKTNRLNALCAQSTDTATDIIVAAAKDGNSVGGRVECVVLNIEAGLLGDASFEGLESKIAYSVFGVPAVKGVEFGCGFDFAGLQGSEANDNFAVENGIIKTITNNNGGINGGISNGMPITLGVAVKPTPSIFKKQQSVDLKTNKQVELTINGRHDACIVPRAVACIESAVCIALLDEAIKRKLI